MPPEGNEKKVRPLSRKLKKNTYRYYYNSRLLNSLRTSNENAGTQTFKLTKDIIKENTASFLEKYGEGSAFQKRLAYLESSLPKEKYEASPEFLMSKIIDDLKTKGIRYFSHYASIGEMYDTVRSKKGKEYKFFSSYGIRAQETAYLKKAKESFKEVEKQINDLIGNEHDLNEGIEEFCADVNSFTTEIDRIVSGGLTVKEADDVSVLHVKLTEKIEVVDLESKQKIIKEVIKEPGVTDDFDSGNDDEDEVEYRSVEDMPLFSHDPCPEDVQQGHVGDCYFIATMCSIASNNPDFIRNCMKDNGDGTVTVRLYDGEDREIYTTVKKTVPMKKVVTDGKEEWKQVYARGGLWVAILEKIYVSSGVVFNVSEQFAKNITKGESKGSRDLNNYEAISGGNTDVATMNILGDNIVEQNRSNMRIDIPKQDLVNPDKYHKEAERFFRKIEADIKNGNTVTAGINEKTNWSDDSYAEFKGLPPGHAYSIVGTEIDENGKMFIKVRNPHSTGARAYKENGTAYYESHPEIPGESRIELDDFIDTFNTCYSANYKQSYFQKVNDELVSADKDMYGDAVMQACDEIIGTDHAFVWTNSDKFIQLKKAAINLKAEYNKKVPDHKKMDDRLNDLFKAAKDYKDDRDTRNQSAAKDARDRSMKRFQLAEAIGYFKDIYTANQHKDAKLQYVDFNECKERALDMKVDLNVRSEADQVQNENALNDIIENQAAGRFYESNAKKATVEGLTKNNDKKTATQESAVKMIADVEKAGLDKIESGLKNYSTQTLMEGLCEVIASRSAKAHQKDVRPEEIERSLSPECISRVRTHFGKKLETALKDINKDDFLKIMSSPDIGKKMADKVQVNLKKNEKEAPVKQEKTVKEGKSANIL